MTERILPPGFTVERRGTGEARHVMLDIEGSRFELHPADALLLGEQLVKVANETEQADGGGVDA